MKNNHSHKSGDISIKKEPVGNGSGFVLPDIEGKNFSIFTFGCKVNRYETEKIRHELIDRGARHVKFGEKADIVIINTCTVTAESDRQCRQIVRRAMKINPDAAVIVTGCILNNPEAGAGIDENAVPVEKERLLSGRTGTARKQTLTRALLKIQDGCDHYCTYCIVPYVRGKSRSVPPNGVVKEAETLFMAGHREIVICGVHLGLYGKDLEEKITLGKLLNRISEVVPGARIRLSSIEPMDLDDETLDAITGNPAICPHLHLPIQHAHPGILRSMNRGYTAEDYSALLAKILSRRPGVSISTDCIAGFPGEGEEEFEALYDYIEKGPFMKLHVFSYSPRPGTPASEFPGQVYPDIKKKRSRRLLELGEKKHIEFLEGLKGNDLEVLIEEKLPGGYVKGTSGKYAVVKALAPDAMPGDIIKVTVNGRDNETALGTRKENQD
ncbi:MAG: MiaB/RimO family radical SAM methylthiotransferase [Chloroflexi bacterium]|nr:MiaB/RimO family radical SAM methylthiotransferase [Chloroflexota bacterium]